MNPMFSDNAGGATSGVLNVKAGDSLDWECHIVNDSDVALRLHERGQDRRDVQPVGRVARPRAQLRRPVTPA